MLPFRKVYVDSKYRTRNSESTTDFSIELPETLTLPNNTTLFITDVAIPHSWFTVEPYNNQLFLRLYGGGFVYQYFLLVFFHRSILEYLSPMF